MAAGMWLYDLLALFETPQMHEALSVTETHKRLPELDESEMTGAFEYSDAYMDDDRLVIETLRDAQRMGVHSANYTEVISAQKKGDSVESLTVKDKVSGKEFKIKAKQVMTSVGPWTDIFGDHIFEDWKKRLRPTKGVHITFARERFPVSRAVVMAVEKRIIFVIPRHEMVIVGTTDTDFKDDPVNVTTQQEDVSYILQAIDKYFPDLGIKQDDIIACYSGVRPLVNDGSESEGKTSREHSIFDHGDNLSFVAGGKYTTYRKMSEDCVDFVLNKMDFNERMSFKASDTKKPLNPLITNNQIFKIKNEKSHLMETYQVSEKNIDFLIERHGQEALYVLEAMKNDFNLHSEDEALWMGEAQFAIEHELCLELEDFYWRRSPLFLSQKDHGLQYLDVISKVFANNYGWDESVKKQKQQKLKDQISKELHWKN